MSLNPQQRKAVETTEGRVLVLAGAGSGKTSVIIHRIAHLIDRCGSAPSSILGLTFTNKAAAEMRQRLSQMIGSKRAKEVALSTFHSFCMHTLRQEIHHLGYTSDFTLYDEEDVQRLVKTLARTLLEHEGELPPMKEALSQISSAKAQGIAAANPFAQQLLQSLQTCMRAYNAVDFDSLLSLTVELFENFPDVLKKLQRRYCYVMIDEYQDTSPVQYRLAALLSAVHNNLCVVGDDDQSIYSWRGAKIEHILEFPADVVIKLEQNFRSTSPIIHAANALIANNQERHPKELWSTQGTGEPLSLFHAPTEHDEAQAVVARLIWYKQHKGLAWKDMAILYRSNIIASSFEAALIDAVWEKGGKWVRGIPYRVFGGTELYERSEIKDLIAYLRAILNPLDQEALLRIINVPRRGISEVALDRLTQHNRRTQMPLWEVLKQEHKDLSAKASKGIKEFVALMEEGRRRFARPPLHTTFEWLIHEINYRKAIEEEVKSDKMRAFKWENVQHCIRALAQYEEDGAAQGESDNISLAHFLSDTLLDKEKSAPRGDEKDGDKLHLMTFHSAKGLEFEASFLVGLEDHLIPHEKSLQERGLEEERRLMYVAITRAKKYLTLSMARNRKRMGKETPSTPSRFLFEIPREIVRVGRWQDVP